MKDNPQPIRPSAKSAPRQSEGEVNFSERRRNWAAANIDGDTRTLLDADADVFLHQSVSTPCLSAIKRAEGIWIEDTQGRRFMDFHGNSVHHIGYGHPRLKAAIAKQMDDLPFAPRRFTCGPAVELAEKLRDISPAGLDKMLFTTGGSDAIEVALKVARMTTGRFKTLSFWDAFHGAGFGASSVGGEQLFRGGRIGPLLAGSEHVAPFACYRCPYGYPDLSQQPNLEICQTACAKYLRYVLEKEGDIAAVIAEPMRAVPYLAPPGFWPAVRQACDDMGALLIFDEIPTGLGKSGRLFACEHEEVTPDILVLGKALGGGILPIAAALCRADLDQAGDFAIGHYTHEKNPVTARAALTTLEIIEDEELVARSAELGDVMLETLWDRTADMRTVGEVRGRGLMTGIELVQDPADKTPAEDLAEAVYYRCLDEGLSFKITMGNVLTLSPPLTISEADLGRAITIVTEAIAAESRTAGLL